jgi:serine/threonine-protein kinase RsbW
MFWYGKAYHFKAVTVDLGLANNLQRAVVRSLAELRPVFGKLEDWMRILGYSTSDIFGMELALHEAATNAIRHGNRRDPRKAVRVSYLVTPAEALVSVEDQGQGFDPSLVPDPRTAEVYDRPVGRGLLLMRIYTSWVSFDPPGNRVTLCVQRSNR